ncbi:MAG: PilZ domain-containing protein [Desulfuromonadaceae bacterium]|nr:PilZ domain-containing protein [Desulfuromonadaceae bacterium]
MERRVFKRYDADLLPEDVTRVKLIFPDKYEIEAGILDISSHGLRVSIPSSSVFLSIPQKDESVKIIFTATQLQVIGRCIYLMNGSSGSMLLGFYVLDPNDQSKLSKIMDTTY